MMVSTYKEITALLKTPGVKASVVINGFPSVSVFCEKTDLIREMAAHKENGKTGPTDYDGNPVQFIYDEDSKILFVDGGI